MVSSAGAGQHREIAFRRRWRARRLARVVRRPLATGRIARIAAVAIARMRNVLASGPLGTVVSLALALLCAVVALHHIATVNQPDALRPATRVGRATRPWDAAIRAQPRPVASPPSPAATLPDDPAVAAARWRLWFSTVPDAAAQLAVPAREPAVLPPDMFPMAVAWQPDGPNPSADGALLSWYAADTLGTILVLEQGIGIGLPYPVTVCAPPSGSGIVTLAGGEPAAWIRGHLISIGEVMGESAECRWEGDELHVGVVARASAWGWRLESGVLSLDELLCVAASLH